MSFIKKSIVILLLAVCGSLTYAQDYQVQPGDTLFLLARRFNTTVNQLQSLNNLSGSSIYPGQTLHLTYSQPNNTSSYTVKPNDTLYLLAKRYGVTVADLKSANNLSSDYLWVGQALKIPSSQQPYIHTVKSGDTLYLLAKQYGITIAELQAANSLPGSMLSIGQKLVIPKFTPSQTSPRSISLSQSDLDLLARLVTAESDGEPYSGQVAVAATILNRLESPKYPKTISGVIYQIVDGKYQYSPVLDGRIYQPASPSAIKAVRDALSGWDPSNGATGFYNPAKTSNTWVRSQKVSTVIGNHTFFVY